LYVSFDFAEAIEVLAHKKGSISQNMSHPAFKPRKRHTHAISFPPPLPNHGRDALQQAARQHCRRLPHHHVCKSGENQMGVQTKGRGGKRQSRFSV